MKTNVLLVPQLAKSPFIVSKLNAGRTSKDYVSFQRAPLDVINDEEFR
jgi:hypothetical protein